MKTRTVVHIALNAKNERVSIMIAICGMLIPFDGELMSQGLTYWPKRKASTWIKDDWATMESLKEWKDYCKESNNAVRFQRITLIGESK